MLENGSRLGSYQIVEAIGAGGMGAVYRAHDTKLGRDVALKVLPDEFAHDAERLSRFQREAHVLASLNHPHIAQIYGLEESGAGPCLVLELVEGETIAEMLQRGPIPVDEALVMARQIAEGVEAAHERSIIHRDLKPANIKQTPDGKIKVLDFGLAKAFETESTPTNLSHSPTMMSARTQPNVLMGTAPYMSPEQVRGKAADELSDIWAFGCVLYEMLTSKPAFDGESLVDIIGAITKTEPDWSLLPAATPANIRTLLRRCLQKDRSQRLHHIADARIEVQERYVETSAPQTTTHRTRTWLAAVSSLMFGVAAMAAINYFRPASEDQPEMRLEVSTPVTSNLGLALSPDARTLVFIVASQGKSQLWIRKLSAATAQALPGTDGAIFPFWSPDNRTIGFFADGKLKRIDISGGLPQTITNAPDARGGTWNSRGTILFNPATGPLYRVPAAGGDAVAVTKLEAGQSTHRYPQFLPDGRQFIYFVLGKPEVGGVYAASLDGSSAKRILTTNSQAVYTGSGFLMFLREGTLQAQPFDVERLELFGEPSPLAERVGRISSFTGSLSISASMNGAMAYRTSMGSDARLVWFDRSGKDSGSVGPVDTWMGLELSPDGKSLAANRSVNGNVDVWTIELSRGVTTRLTTDPGDDEWPVWSPDGSRIVFDSTRKGSFDLFQTAATGRGTEELLLETPDNKAPTAWSSDGRYLLYEVASVGAAVDLWVLPLFGDRKPFSIANQGSDELSGRFSRDMQWVTLASNESGRFEIYVQSFKNPVAKWQVSTGGGFGPRWRADGRELFYIAPDGVIMAVPIVASPNGLQIEPGRPLPLFKTQISESLDRSYAVTADGQRFLVTVPVETASSPITILLNWSGFAK